MEGSWGSSSPCAAAEGWQRWPSPARSSIPAWTAREGGSVPPSSTRPSARTGGWARLPLEAGCCSEIPVSFDPADPGFFSFHRHSQSPSVHEGFNLMLGQGQSSWDSSGWRCWLPGERWSFFLWQPSISVLLGCWFFFLSFSQEKTSKQNLCSKCTYRLKVKAFKIEINQSANILSYTPRAWSCGDLLLRIIPVQATAAMPLNSARLPGRAGGIS